MSFQIDVNEIYSLEEVSKKLGVEIDALKRTVRKGDLIARKIGDAFFVTGQNLLTFLQTPPPPPASRKKPKDPAGEAAPPPPPPAPRDRDTSPVPGLPGSEQRMHKSLLDSEEMPSVHVPEMRGSASPPPPVSVIPDAPPPPPSYFPEQPEPTGVEVSKLSAIPDMFGPESPTLVIRPELLEQRPSAGRGTLEDLVEQGRIAEKERNRIVEDIRRLPIERQSAALSGEMGARVVHLDRIISEGARAREELGLPPSEPITRLPVAAPFEEIPPTAEARAEKEPPPVEVSAAEIRKIQAEAAQLNEPVFEVTDPMPLVSQTPAPGPTPSFDPTGGESWKEVGLPTPASEPTQDYQLQRGQRQPEDRVVFTLNDEERKILTEHGIKEDTAIAEIYEKFQPTNEKSWEYARHRYFQPLRMKSISW